MTADRKREVKRSARMAGMAGMAGMPRMARWMARSPQKRVERGFSVIELLMICSISVIILAITAYTYTAIERKSRQQQRVEKAVARLRGDLVRAAFQAQRGMESEVKCEDYGLSVSCGGKEDSSEGVIIRFLPPYGELDPSLLKEGAQAVSVVIGEEPIWYRITTQRSGVFYIDPFPSPSSSQPPGEQPRSNRSGAGHTAPSAPSGSADGADCPSYPSPEAGTGKAGSHRFYPKPEPSSPSILKDGR